MNTVTASYTTADGRKLETTFSSHTTHLLAQYQAAEREMKAQADARAERAASPLAFPDLCRLSRAFLAAADLRDGQDLRINEWLKNALATHPENT